MTLNHDSMPTGPLAGRRRLPAREPGLVVDYADVLAQAVINEREKVLRELYSEVSRVSVRKNRSYDQYGTEAKSAEEAKSEILDIIHRKQA